MNGTYSNVVFQLDTSRRVKFHLLQGLAHNVVRLTLACLCGLDGGGLVNVALVVDIEVAEGIAQFKDLILLELRKFPVRKARVSRGQRRLARTGQRPQKHDENSPLKLENVHDGRERVCCERSRKEKEDGRGEKGEEKTEAVEKCAEKPMTTAGVGSFWF